MVGKPEVMMRVGRDYFRLARHPGRTQEILAARGLFNESPTQYKRAPLVE
jgi:hypothetical protein